MLKYLLLQVVFIVNLFNWSCLAGNITYEESIVTVNVNNEPWDNLYNIIIDSSGNFLLLLDDIKPADLKEEFIRNALVTVHDKEYVNINKLEGTKIKFDDNSLDLEINFPANQFNNQILNFDPNLVPVRDITGKEISGVFLNYDLTLSNLPDIQSIVGVQDLNYFTQEGILHNTFYIRHEIPKKGSFENNYKKKSRSKIVRFNTNWTSDDYDNLARWRIGDSVTKPADWSGSSRFFGIQYSTNFSVRSNLVTYPLIDFNGRAELPSTIDIYANSLHMFSKKSRTGDYELANIAVPTGQGELEIKTKDITGKIQTFILPYYIPPNLLAKDLCDFSYEVGMQRQNFGNEESYYKNLIINANYIKGITNKWTGAIHYESLKDQATIGTSHYVQLGHYGVLSTAVATNINNLSKSQKLQLGYSYEGRQFNYDSNITFSGTKYQDVYVHPHRNPTSTNFHSSIGYHNNKLGSFYLNFIVSYLQNSHHKQDKIKVVSGGYIRHLPFNTIIRMTIGSNLGRNEKSNFGSISFFKNWGSRGLEISNSYKNKESIKRLNYSSPVNKPLGWGYRANLTKGKTNDYDLQLDKKSQKVDTSVYLYNYGGEHTQQIGFTGSVVMMDKNLYLTKSIYDSLALVRVGDLENIPVYFNNLKTGYTNSKGKILIPNIISYVPSEIRLDPKKLPLDTNIDTTVITVAPKSRSGVIVDFDVKKIRSVEVVLLDSAKQIIPFDQEVKIDNITEELFVGYEGKLYINDIGSLQTIDGKSCKNEDSCCQFSVELDKNNKDPIIDLGEVICH